MRLGCPKCGALYEVDAAAIPETGREVQCSACDHRWFFRATAAKAAEPEAPRARGTDPAVLQILREEAARELAARRREAGHDQVEQEKPVTTPVPHAGTRRPLLPEIEGGGEVVVHPMEEERWGGFGVGLVVSLLLASLAAGVYIWAADLAEVAPQLADVIGAYVDTVDRARAMVRDWAG
mgnify:CR=1 FL=1